MNFIKKLREKVVSKEIPYIFNKDDLKSFSEDDIKNISNYDLKNEGSTNKNKKVLLSRKINNIPYYVFKNLEEC